MRSRAILRSTLVMLITGFPFLLAIAQTGNPHISSVTQVWARPNQTIQIAGSGFGSTRPYDGDSGFIRIVDLTQKWGAGRNGDAVTLNIGSWSDSLISVNYFDGAYGTGNQSLLAGDVVVVEVWNAQTGAGPGKYSVTVLANATALYNFKGEPDSAGAGGGLIMDGDGNFYGVAGGGTNICDSYYGCGTVYELTREPTGTWSETVLYNFQGGSSGWSPVGTLVRDSAGNLYGVTLNGGSTSACFLGLNCGIIFEISGGVETVLHTFQFGSDGGGPKAGLTVDAVGNMYGTTTGGGTLGFGTVYELSPNGSGGWNYSIIYQFQGGASGDGSSPYSALTLDSAGDLYGTTYSGGSTEYCFVYLLGCGTVFELSPSGSGTFTEHVLHVFRGTSKGVQPTAGVTFDASGNLYGVTEYGGPPCNTRHFEGCGVAYALRPRGDGTWEEKTIINFSDNVNNVDGSTYPSGDLTYYNGMFYGYAEGGASDVGSLYVITPANGSWSEETTYSFGATSDGGSSIGRPLFGSDGTLYGATSGAVYSLP